MNPLFDRVAIIGVGLLGASLGLAMKQRGIAESVCGVGRRRETLETALRRGCIDVLADSPAEAAAVSDLIVIATPAALVIPTMDRILPALKPGSIVTDVASTKGAICRHADRTWPTPRFFVGSHPMAGSEKSGPENAVADLYDDAVCLMESSGLTDSGARERIRRLWEAVGARVVETDPAAHDRILAHTSHLPHVTASALALLAAAHGGAAAFTGNGFRDTTRIADSNPEVWRDICLTNGEAMIEALKALQEELAAVARLIEAGDAEGLDRFFDTGRRGRREVLES